MKNSKSNSDDCIITVLDANDLPPFNPNTSPRSLPTNNSNTHSTSNRISNHRNVLHRFLIFHRSDQIQI